MVRIFEVIGILIPIIGMSGAANNQTCGVSGQETCEDAQIEHQKVSMLQYRAANDNIESSKRRAELLAEIASIDDELKQHYEDCKYDQTCGEGFMSGVGVNSEAECQSICKDGGADWAAYNYQTKYCMCYEGECSHPKPWPPFKTCKVSSSGGGNGGGGYNPGKYVKLQDAFCSDDEYDTRLNGWTKGSHADAGRACSNNPRCKGYHYSVKNSNYVLVPTLQKSSVDTNGPNECYMVACRTGGYCPADGYASESTVSSESACESFCSGKGWYCFNPTNRYCMCYNGDCSYLTGNSDYVACPVVEPPAR